MEIVVKLYATLAQHLPPGARQNQVTLDLPDDATPAFVIDRLNMAREKCHLVLVNGVYIAPSQLDHHPLRPGDAVAMWPPVAGG